MTKNCFFLHSRQNSEQRPEETILVLQERSMSLGLGWRLRAERNGGTLGAVLDAEPTLLADEIKVAEEALKVPAWQIAPFTMRKMPQASTKGMGKGDLRSKDILTISVLRSLDFVKDRESEHLEDIRNVI